MNSKKISKRAVIIFLVVVSFIGIAYVAANNAKTYFYIACVESEFKHYDSSIQNFNRAIELDPNNALYYFGRGFTYIEQKNYELGFKDYEKALEINPNYYEVYFARAATYYLDFKDPDKVLDNLNKGIEINPNFKPESTHLLRAAVYYHKENYEQAIADYNKVIEVAPNSADAYHWRGMCYKTTGDEAKAQADFDKAKELGYKD